MQSAIIVFTNGEISILDLTKKSAKQSDIDKESHRQSFVAARRNGISSLEMLPGQTGLISGSNGLCCAIHVEQQVA